MAGVWGVVEFLFGVVVVGVAILFLLNIVFGVERDVYKKPRHSYFVTGKEKNDNG